MDMIRAASLRRIVALEVIVMILVHADESIISAVSFITNTNAPTGFLVRVPLVSVVLV